MKSVFSQPERRPLFVTFARCSFCIVSRALTRAQVAASALITCIVVPVRQETRIAARALACRVPTDEKRINTNPVGPTGAAARAGGAVVRATYR